jgi:EmrB/QacA subfamily drug resistance transporter
VLAVVLLAAFAINLDTTIVNVALPTLSRQLHATTTDLQWVVDGYNLAFAALVLTGGTIGDRYGRRTTLAAGLVVFAFGSAVAALATGPGMLIVPRVVMGVAAALIFPTTLSIITQTFPDRAARAKAIGAWGAVTGIGVAIGPIAGGLLLSRFWWGSVFLALVPVAVIAFVGTLLVVPRGRAHVASSLDVRGLALSVVTLGSLVYTIIEAPAAGWGSPRTLAGFAVAAVALLCLIAVERTQDAPMLDVRLFANLRFTAASGAVTVAFFSLFGFIFLITQYMQILRGYSALSTGVRILPVAASIAITSATGTLLAVRIGNKAVVATGLGLLVAAFTWISFATADLPYWVIALQMIVLGSGLGLTTAPATESIMGVVRPDQAGVGSAVNDATREVGGTLGVAIIGSVYASLYRSSLADIRLPDSARQAARSSYAASRAVGAHLPAELGQVLAAHADQGFLDGLHAGCLVAAGVCLVGAIAVLALLPARPEHADLSDGHDRMPVT